MKKNELPYNKDSGFKVPKGYFEDFEARMMAQVTLNDDSLEKDLLGDNSLKKNPFKVPNNYFEQVGDSIFEKLDAPAKKGRVIPMFSRRTLSYVAGFAAVLAILFSSVVLNNSRTVSFEDLDVVAVENYLLESLDFNNPNETPVNDYNFTATANPNIDKEALFDYLNENIEEPALLFNED